mmetsp:Transcript_51956/g.85985  ORF Transcript_51956/g.85985 Transcript_51956/m.85985 type:complete len:358 (+) Transcript_51956:160-1233(+)
MSPVRAIKQLHRIRMNASQLRYALLRISRYPFTQNASKITITVESEPFAFRLFCLCAGFSITSSSFYFLRENLLFGTMAGITAKTCTAPLERLTTHRQASMDTTLSLYRVCRDIYDIEGLAGFWRGNLINVFRASIQKGSLFACNDFFRNFAEQHFNLADSASTAFVCGSLSGVCSTLITYPLEVVKNVNQTTIHQRPWPAMTIWYHLVQCNGYIGGPWIAGLPTFVGTSTYYGIKFLLFDEISKLIDCSNTIYDISMPMDIRNATAGLFSGVLANCLTHPNNCVRKRMQTSHVCHALDIQSEYKAQKYWQTAMTLWKEGGVRRFYRGLVINLCRNGPNTALQFMVYKRLQQMWNVQ